MAFPPSGAVTLRAAGAEAATEGTPVRDARGVLEGRVTRVFGPVARPYLSVRPRRVPTPDEASALIGATVLRR